MNAELSPTMILADIELILIPAGEFTMGSDKPSEQPVHEVYLDAFYIGKYPITNAQYERFVEATGRRPALWPTETYPVKRNHPVEGVGRNNARAYCQWLADETGQAVRLPTEAEWEKAARGTDGRVYPWGDEFDVAKCNSDYIGKNKRGITTPVGQYSPEGDSPYGVADMAGNVWEWTSSLYTEYPYNSDDGREDPGASGIRVLRGGAYLSYPYYVRCACRLFEYRAYQTIPFGFRVVVSPGSAQ